MTYMPINLPPDEFIEAIHGPVTRVTRRVDIYESDRETLWLGDVGFTEGQVDIDHARPERRVGDLVLNNEDGALTPDSGGGFWYDKVIKIYRGVRTRTDDWETQIAEFRIDSFLKPRSSSQVSIKCRDHSKSLIGSKLVLATTYPENHPIEEAIRDLAISGGIPIEQIDLPLTGESLGRDYTFDSGTDRWSAISEVALAYNYEVFFTADGMLTMREHQDPFTLPPAYTFETGLEGNLTDFNKEATDALLRNHIIAIGESAADGAVPVWYEAKNTKASSPTNIARLGQRTEEIKSVLIETFAQAEDVAKRALRSMAMEQFSINLSSIVVPYMDVGVVIEFADPDPAPGDPSKYLMQSLTIPLGLGAMTGKAGRVTDVGEG